MLILQHATGNAGLTAGFALEFLTPYTVQRLFVIVWNFGLFSSLAFLTCGFSKSQAGIELVLVLNPWPILFSFFFLLLGNLSLSKWFKCYFIRERNKRIPGKCDGMWLKCNLCYDLTGFRTHASSLKESLRFLQLHCKSLIFFVHSFLWGRCPHLINTLFSNVSYV